MEIGKRDQHQREHSNNPYKQDLSYKTDLTF